jgi:uncharacterized membrane protein
MPNLHPFLVHFPIALLSVSFLFDVLSMITSRDELERTAWWTLLTGTLGLAAAVITGLIAENTVTIYESAREHFETHEQVAFSAAALYAFLIFWRIANRTRLPKRKSIYYVGLSLLGIALIWVAAWYGGEMVYRFRVGVTPS